MCASLQPPWKKRDGSTFTRYPGLIFLKVFNATLSPAFLTCFKTTKFKHSFDSVSALSRHAQARSGKHAKVVAYLEAARERMLAEGKSEPAKEELASEERIQERFRRMASFGRAVSGTCY